MQAYLPLRSAEIDRNDETEAKNLLKRKTGSILITKRSMKHFTMLGYILGSLSKLWCRTIRKR